MKMRHHAVLPVLIAVLNLPPTGSVTAQTFTTLHSFTANVGTNSDGAYPQAGLFLSGNTLYGTAVYGGCGAGTVFAVKTDGTGFTTLHCFTALSASRYTNSDGAQPVAELVLSGNTLYGTAPYGPAFGTVFAVNTDGTGFTNLHDFNGRDGAWPLAGLVLSGNTLYGASAYGGSFNGTVFAVNTDGSDFRNLYCFTAASGYYVYTNSDGANPTSGLVLSGNMLYGTAAGGGSAGYGTVFAINTNGTGFTNLHNFVLSDGANPYARLLLSGNTLYGTTYNGGNSGVGTVFAVNTDGTGFTNLHSFTADWCPYPECTGKNSDGANPYGGLILSGNTLYGTAQNGGSSRNGTVFAVNTDGTGFTNLHSFTAGSGSYPNITNSDGANPQAGLILSGNTLYGTAYAGGIGRHGTVFSISLPVPPTEQINGLIALALGMGLRSGTADSLIAKLQSAGNALDRGNTEAACGNLGAFLNEVNAQTDKQLTAAQADLLNSEATRIRVVMNCQ